MKRIHWIEISDEPWCPQGIRHSATDYCRFLAEKSGQFNAVAPLLAEAVLKTGDRRIVDLAAGGGGPWLTLLPLMKKQGLDVSVCLTDYNPNLEGFERAQRLSEGAITFHAESVDGTQVPAQLSGFRTIFSAFHHFRPDKARALLADAVANQQGIGVFEGGSRSLLLLPLYLPTPLRVLILTPFIRPFRWSRLFWTYVVPVFPFIMLFDCIVSCLRIYNVEELQEMTTGLEGYYWDIGTLRGSFMPMSMTYLIGVPIRAEKAG